MKFELPDSLLLELVARRDAQRAERVARGSGAPSETGATQNFAERVGEMVRREDSEGFAEKYVSAMNTWQDAKKTGIAELLDLLPKPPQGAITCPKCNGTRWWERFNGELLCSECRAFGWILPEGNEA